MTLTHLLDTDVVIDVLRNRQDEARERLAAMGSGVAVSAVTVMELAYGAARSGDPHASRSAVDEFLSFVTVVELDVDAATHAGEVRAELAASGRPIGAYDVLIAGTARSRGMLLVTGNVGEFGRVDGLRLSPWLR